MATILLKSHIGRQSLVEQKRIFFLFEAYAIVMSWEILVMQSNFVFSLFWGKVLYHPGLPHTYYVSKDGLELLIPWSLPLKCWDVRFETPILAHKTTFQKSFYLDWKHGSVVKSSVCSSRELRLNSQHLYSGWKPSATPRYEGSSSDLHGHQACTWCTDIHVCKTPLHRKY